MSLALGKHWLQEKNLLANVLMGFGQSLGQRKHSRERGQHGPRHERGQSMMCSDTLFRAAHCCVVQAESSGNEAMDVTWKELYLMLFPRGVSQADFELRVGQSHGKKSAMRGS